MGSRKLKKATAYPRSASGHSRRYCHVRSLVCYPRHRTHYRALPSVIWLSLSCVGSASNGLQPLQLLRPGLGRSGEHDAHAARPRAGIPAAVSVARKLPPGRIPCFLSDRNVAKDSAGLAGCTPSTERWQDKSRRVRRGRIGEDARACYEVRFGLQPAILRKPARHHGIPHLVGPEP